MWCQIRVAQCSQILVLLFSNFGDICAQTPTAILNASKNRGKIYTIEFLIAIPSPPQTRLVEPLGSKLSRRTGSHTYRLYSYKWPKYADHLYNQHQTNIESTHVSNDFPTDSVGHQQILWENDRLCCFPTESVGAQQSLWESLRIRVVYVIFCSPTERKDHHHHKKLPFGNFHLLPLLFFYPRHKFVHWRYFFNEKVFKINFHFVLEPLK